MASRKNKDKKTRAKRPGPGAERRGTHVWVPTDENLGPNYRTPAVRKHTGPRSTPVPGISCHNKHRKGGK